MSVDSVLWSKENVRQEHIAENNLSKVYDRNRDDPPKDVSEALMDGCPSER